VCRAAHSFFMFSLVSLLAMRHCHIGHVVTVVPYLAKEGWHAVTGWFDYKKREDCPMKIQDDSP